MSNEKIKKLKRILKIDDEILGIYFTDKKPVNLKKYKDTACTALARCFFQKEKVFFDAKYNPQLCPGADYFLKLKKIKNSEAIDVYVKKEHVFQNRNICKSFLSGLPQFPKHLKNKFIIIKPLNIKENPKIIILLLNPAQVGRIIGLANYNKYKKIETYPNQPTCLAFFAPLVTKNLHINFLDYYDRYHQGRINNKNIWPENKMIVSMSYSDFKIILTNLEKSPHGKFKPKLSPARISGFK